MATSRIVLVHGPLWSGEAEAAVRDWVDKAKKDVAQLGDDYLHNAALYRMNKTLYKRGRAHTGGAARSISMVHSSPDWIVRGESQTGVVWWPWLEGTSRRNQSTRFKGYHVFRKARIYMASTARKVAQRNLDLFIGRMGGHIG